MKRFVLPLIGILLIASVAVAYYFYPSVREYVHEALSPAPEAPKEVNGSLLPDGFISEGTLRTLDAIVNIYPYSDYKLALQIERNSDTRTLFKENMRMDAVNGGIYYWESGTELYYVLRLEYYSPGLSIEENLEGFTRRWTEEEQTEMRNICTLRTWEADGVTYYQLGFDEVLWREYLSNKYAAERGPAYIGSFCGEIRYVLMGSIFVGYYPPPADPFVPRAVPGSARLVE